MNANIMERNAAVSEIAARFDNRPELLVQILVTLVRERGWVAESDIRQLADSLNLSRAEVHGVVEYYHDFRTAAPGKHVVKICRAEACQAMGSRELEAHARGAIDDDVTIEPVFCLGNCACAPAVMINSVTHGRVDSARFDVLLGALSEGE